jgi:transcriptional regulator GlxA family with amidase domain
MKTIGFYVSPGFQMLDLAGPAGAFEAANRELGRLAYRITVMASEAGPRDEQPRHYHRCRVGRRGRA